MFASFVARIKEFLAGLFGFAKAESKKLEAQVESDYNSYRMRDATAPTVAPKY